MTYIIVIRQKRRVTVADSQVLIVKQSIMYASVTSFCKLECHKKRIRENKSYILQFCCRVTEYCKVRGNGYVSHVCSHINKSKIECQHSLNSTHKFTYAQNYICSYSHKTLKLASAQHTAKPLKDLKTTH